MLLFSALWKRSYTAYLGKYLFSILSLFFIINIVRGQNNFSFRHITSADGLTSNNTGKIIQDSRGFLWIATQDGLNMYDGQTIKQYYLSDYVPSQANSNTVSGVAEDADHNILLAARAGIIKFSWETKQFSVAYKNSFTGFGNLAPDLFVDAEKNIWVNERVRIRKFDPHFHLLHTWNLRDSTNSKNLNGPSVTFICGDDNHHDLWFADSSSVFRIDATTNVVDSSENKKLKHVNLDFAHVDLMGFSQGSVWIIQSEHILIHLTSSFRFIRSYEISKQVIPFYSGIIEQNDKLWIATHFNGVFALDIHTGQFQHYGENNALSSDNVSNITKDVSGNIWISTFAGVDELLANSTLFKQLTFDIPTDSVAQKSIIHQTFFKHNALFTFMSNGIMRTHLERNESTFFFDAGEKNWEGVYYSSAAPFADKWLVSRHRDVEILEVKNNRLFFSTPSMPHPSELDSSGVVSFYEDHDKNIWMGLVNERGIVCWHTSNNSFAVYSQKDTGKNYCPLRHLSYAAEDAKGNVWMGYDKGGIAIFDKKQNRFVPIPSSSENSISNAAVSGITSDGQNLWISTSAGLFQYNEPGNSYRVFTRKEGLPSNFVKSIIADDAGHVWMGFEGALAELNISSNAITTYNTVDGLPGEDLENPFYDPSSETMFFCTDRRVVYFNPRQAGKIIPEVNPVVTSLQIMGNEQSVSITRKLEIPYSRNYLAFAFSAPNFINATETEYACKLEGADNNWNYLGNHHFANYSQLPPGDYTFKVMARVKGGKWQQSSSPVQISILAPFWRTAWFWILFIVLFLTVVFSFIYLRLRSNFEKKMLAQSIRDKIAGDLHDDIGSTLSSISILSELAKQNSSQAAPYLENISRNTSLMQENMNDIVWAINPKNDRFVNIIQHMSQFAAEVLEPKNIDVNFNSDESLSALMLPMGKRKNFYLFFKEAINNCAKYSAASRVDILITSNEGTIDLKIKDNGNGFDPEVAHKGNGMSTMKKRAEELNGHMEIVSARGKGTSVCLQFEI